ncbi:MAG: 4-hydroxy-tetrahydrodipicolinate synthase [Rikenellaceae bacterium]|nr:4-hydroxy-tetrahydrodipicolinate synthase [Rikenellaceae bacterium]MBO5759056.1 4-hydroxy-tetrahydrodipicolinate synthase [Rikenellaceae bacterium]
MSKFDYKGVGVALITPFNADGSVDFGALGRIMDSVIDGGVDYIVALGTTAETPAIVQDEREAIARYIKLLNNNRVPLVIGIGGNCTKEVIDGIVRFDLRGFDAVLSVTPYYNKPSQEGLYHHYKAIAQASPLPIILYNVPSRTGVNMTAETTLRLAHLPNIIGIKEASGNMEQIKAILRDKPEEFFVLSGDDSLTLDIMDEGGLGVISVAANSFPKSFCRMIHSQMEGNKTEARAIETKLMPSMKMLFEEGNPTGVKTALYAKGLIQPFLRLPMVFGSESLVDRLRVAVNENE